jgi:hypothetical protein
MSVVSQPFAKTAIRPEPGPPSRLVWQLTLLLAGVLYAAADLFFDLEFPLFGVAIVLILARELARSHTPRCQCASFDGTRLPKQASQRFVY